MVVHVPLETLRDESSELPGELERDGLLAAETVRRLACDTTVAVAIDDRLGHTMFEGRARRWPTASQRREIMRSDRHCRFPGCANVIFTNVHHVVPWKPGGRTDLDNLALLCEHHHHRVHSQSLDHVRGREQRADVRRSNGSRHDVAPVAGVGRRDGSGGDKGGAER